jgi:hypothetical protein
MTVEENVGDFPPYNPSHAYYSLPQIPFCNCHPELERIANALEQIVEKMTIKED